MNRVLIMLCAGLALLLISAGIVLPQFISSELPLWIIIPGTLAYAGFLFFLLTQLIRGTIYGEWNIKQGNFDRKRRQRPRRKKNG